MQTTAHTHISSVRTIRRQNESESKNSEFEKGIIIRNQKKLFYSKIVQIFNPDHPEKSAFALASFDNMSERTYIREKIAQKLELESINPAQIELSGFAGKNLGKFTMSLTKIGIKTKKEGDKILYPERTSKILRSIDTVELDEKEAKELKRFKLNPPKCRVPDLLIGIDYYNEFNIIREKQLSSGFWISKSVVGKMLSGTGNFVCTQKANPIISQIMSSTIEEKIVVETQEKNPINRSNRRVQHKELIPKKLDREKAKFLTLNSNNKIEINNLEIAQIEQIERGNCNDQMEKRETSKSNKQIMASNSQIIVQKQNMVSNSQKIDQIGQNLEPIPQKLNFSNKEKLNLNFSNKEKLRLPISYKRIGLKNTVEFRKSSNLNLVNYISKRLESKPEIKAKSERTKILNSQRECPPDEATLNNSNINLDHEGIFK